MAKSGGLSLRPTTVSVAMMMMITATIIVMMITRMAITRDEKCVFVLKNERLPLISGGRAEALKQTKQVTRATDRSL